METRERAVIGGSQRSTTAAAGLSSGRLEAEILTLTERLAAGTYELLVLVGELDARSTWAAWGALSCAAWLADACDVEVGTEERSSATSAMVPDRHGARWPPLPSRHVTERTRENVF